MTRCVVTDMNVASQPVLGVDVVVCPVDIPTHVIAHIALPPDVSCVLCHAALVHVCVCVCVCVMYR